ncbi:MAG: DUF3299 domain-containing protein [Paracoccaceae bacterium]
MKRFLSRRAVLAGMATAALTPRLAQADTYIDLEWYDLLPENQTFIPNVVRELLEHDESAGQYGRQPASTGVRPDWNGQIVRLSGFVVPIDYSGTGVTSFILVPYVGACVHVPPPPANQLVFVTTQIPFESPKLFEPVRVIGKFGISSVSTHLAQVGYSLTADSVEPFRAF